MRPAGRCRLLSKASLLQADKRGLMFWSVASETHFQTGALRHDSTRPRGNVLAHTVLKAHTVRTVHADVMRPKP